MRLTPDGVMVTELAPGVDLERDVLAQADFPLRVAADLKPMDAALFRARARSASTLPERLTVERRPVALEVEGPLADHHARRGRRS